MAPSVALVAALSLAAVHCASAKTSSPQPPPTLRSFIDAYTEATCLREDRCAAVLGRAYVSHALCVAQAVEAADYTRYYFGTDYFGDLAVDYADPSAEAQATCLGALANSDCSSSATTLAGACAAAFALKNPKTEGQSCNLGSHASRATPCGNGLICSSGSGRCPVCVAFKSHDEPCTQSEDCGGGHCNKGRCRPADATAGEACETGNDCAGNLDCRSGSGVAVCTARVGAGAPCNEFDTLDGTARCQYGLRCDLVLKTMRGTCRPLGLNGETCWRNPVTPQMPCHQWCIFGRPDAPQGTCGVPPAGQPEHTPCNAFSQNKTLDCERGMAPSALTPAEVRPSCECLARRPAGGACERGDQCAGATPDRTGHCLLGSSTADGGAAVGTCGSGLPVGGACDASVACESFSCDPKIAQCVVPAPPACPSR